MLGEIPVAGNLRAYYKLENTNDSGANAFNLTNNNSVSFNAGRLNKGADFGSSGTNKRLNIASNILASSSDAFSVTFWFKLNNTSSANANATIFVITAGTASGDTSASLRYSISGGSITLTGILNTSITDTTTTVTFTADSNWHFVIYRLSGTTIDIYVDGDKYSGTNTGTGTKTGVGSTLGFSIGNRNAALDRQVWMIIDQFIVYPTAAGFGNYSTRIKTYTNARGRLAL